MQTGRVQKDHLAVVLVDNAGDPGTGGLGFVRNDGHFAAAEGICQSGFSCIGTANDRENTGFRNHILYPFITGAFCPVVNHHFYGSDPKQREFPLPFPA